MCTHVFTDVVGKESVSGYICALICNVFFLSGRGTIYKGAGKHTVISDIDQPGPAPSCRLSLAPKDRDVVDPARLSPLSHAGPRNTAL